MKLRSLIRSIATRRTTGLIAVGVGLPLYYLAWMFLGWPASIEVSTETTYLTSPLTEDGKVDYAKALLGGYSRESVADDRLFQLTFPGDYRLLNHDLSFLPKYADSYAVERKRVDALVEANPEHSDANLEATQIYRELSRPLDLQKSADLVEVIRANEPWFHKAAEIIDRGFEVRVALIADQPPTRFLYDYDFVPNGLDRELSRRFGERAALAFGEEDYDRAAESLRVGHVVSEKWRDIPFALPWLSSRTCKQHGLIQAAMVDCDSIPEKHLQRIEQFVTADPPKWEEVLRLHETSRIETLSWLSQIHAGVDAAPFYIPDTWKDWLILNATINSTDWNEMFRTVNDAADEFEQARRNLPLSQIGTELARIESKWTKPEQAEELESLSATLIRNPTPLFIKAAVQRLSIDLTDCFARLVNSRRATLLAIRAHRVIRDEGRLPHGLNELLEARWGGRLESDLQMDALTGQPFAFESTDELFWIGARGDFHEADEPARRGADGLRIDVQWAAP